MPTYKQFKKFLRDKCWNERDYGEGIYDKLIYDFLVEEVKENEEYSSINEFCALNGVSEQHRAMLNTFLAIEHTKANSILKKLKADIEKRIEENEGAEAGTEYAKGAYYAYKNIEMLLTPLETKEDREAKAWQKLNNGKYWAKNDDCTITITSCEEVWTPTPGQIIEVSNDGEKWYGKPLRFEGMNPVTNDYMTLDPNYLVGGPMKDWKFARPIEDKIELVPKWAESYHLTGCTQNTREKQIELLTNAVNKLISK